MNDFRTIFTTWWSTFKNSGHPDLLSLKSTVENSPWHREENTYVHTCMVVDQYVSMCDERTNGDWSKNDMLGAVAAVFHDFGKPMSEETLSREDGTEYRRYAGHEQMSGGYWINFWMENHHNIQTLVQSEFDFYLVHVLIAYHLPYDSNDEKLGNLKYHMLKTSTYDVFINLLRADTHGRIPDDKPASVARMEEWIEKFDNFSVEKIVPSNGSRSMYFMVGPAGAGKSSVINSLFVDGDEVFSFDTIRTRAFPTATYNDSYRQWSDYFSGNAKEVDWIFDEFGITGYKEGIELNDSGVFMYVFGDVVKRHKVSKSNIFIDNTSLTYSSRRKLRNMSNGMVGIKTVAVMKYKTFNRLVLDNLKRNGKNVSSNVLRVQMFDQLAPPIFGEMDEIYIDLGK